MSRLAFDTETKGLGWWDVSEQAFLISWATADGEWHAHVDDKDGVAAFLAAVDEADELVAHNASFDVHHLRAAGIIDLSLTGKTIIDTDQLARVVLPERQYGEGDANGYKLKNLGRTYVDPGAKDTEDAIVELAKAAGIKLKSTGGYYDTWRAYPSEMEEYARMDARTTYDLLPKLEAKMTEERKRIWALELATTPVLIAAEQRGVQLDRDVVKRLIADYEPRTEAAHKAVAEVLGEEALEGSNALLDALLKHGVPLYRKTASGEQLATHKFALAEFEDQFPVLASLSEWRQCSKFLSTYLYPMQDRDVVHTTFWQQGARTGRMSCSRPNMQNIPSRAGSEVREMFVPRKGHVFLVYDYDSIEVRLLAHYLNAPEYTQLIEEGMDPHAWMASKIYGGEPEQYLKGTPGEKQRGIAKNVLFAIVYGAGAPRVADMLGIEKAEAKALINTIKNSLPRYMDLAGYKGRVRRKIEATGYVTTVMGRKQSVKADKAYVGLNALIQGSAADCFKAGAVATAEALKAYDGHLVLFVHDELVAEVPTKHATKAGQAMELAMTQAYTMRPPLLVTGTVCKTNYAEGK